MSGSVCVMLNGERRELPATVTIAELISLLEVRGRYAVEVNGAIVPRSLHAEHLLHDNDRVEVVAAIGGG